MVVGAFIVAMCHGEPAHLPVQATESHLHFGRCSFPQQRVTASHSTTENDLFCGTISSSAKPLLCRLANSMSSEMRYCLDVSHCKMARLEAPFPPNREKCVPVIVRGFLNTDLNAIEAIRRAHLAKAGFDLDPFFQVHEVSALRFWEDYLLGKPSFDPTLFLIAELDDQVVGFLHGSRLSNETQDDFSEELVALNNLAVAPHPAETEIASVLIVEFEQRCLARKFQTVLATDSPSHCASYLGLTPGTGRLGVLAQDSRLHHWIQAAGYAEIQKNEKLKLPLTNFRVSMDRGMIQCGRRFDVRKIMTTAGDSWWEANMYSHMEGVDYQLINKSNGMVQDSLCMLQMTGPLAALDYGVWGIKLSHVTQQRLNGDMLASELAELSTQVRFLICEAAKDLQISHAAIEAYERVGDETRKIMQELGFEPTLSGITYRKSLK